MHESLGDKKFSSKTLTINKSRKRKRMLTAAQSPADNASKKMRQDEISGNGADVTSPTKTETKGASEGQEEYSTEIPQELPDDELYMQRQMIEKMNAQRELLRLRREKEKEKEELSKYKFRKAIQKTKEKQSSKGRAYLEEQRQKYLSKKKKRPTENDTSEQENPLQSLLGKSKSLNWTKRPQQFTKNNTQENQSDSDNEWEVIDTSLS